jgi:hypothetical protein
MDKDEELYEDEGLYDDRRSSHGRVPSRRRRISLGTAGSLLGVILFVAGIVLYTYVFDSATITLTPKYKDIQDVGKTFVFSKEGVDASGIPFVVETTSLSKTKTLPLSESRKVESKATGKAIIYNNYDGNTQKLIKNTRFESSKGKIYRINQSIEVPGKKGDTPGSVEVTLYADSAGAEYNIDSTTFSIPGFKGTSRESAFYAKTKSAISGGSSGTMSLPSISDLNSAKDSLALELKQSIQDDLHKIKKDGYIPLYSSAEIAYSDNEEDIRKGVTDSYKVTATAYVMLTDASKLAEALAKTFGDYDGGAVRLLSSDGLSFTRKQTDAINGANTISLLVDGKARVVWVTDSDAVKSLVQGKERDMFKGLMKTVSSVDSAEISFSPMWLTHFPDTRSKLTVTESLPKR